MRERPLSSAENALTLALSPSISFRRNSKEAPHPNPLPRVRGRGAGAPYAIALPRPPINPGLTLPYPVQSVHSFPTSDGPPPWRGPRSETSPHASEPCEPEERDKTQGDSARAAHVLRRAFFARRKILPWAVTTGPKVKLSRRVGVPIADVPKHTGKGDLVSPACTASAAAAIRIWRAPGGKTEAALLLWHVRKQFRRFFDIAKKSKGNTANTMMQLLELRLDNVLRRSASGAPSGPPGRSLPTGTCCWMARRRTSQAVWSSPVRPSP